MGENVRGVHRKSYKSHWDLVKPVILTNAWDAKNSRKKNHIEMVRDIRMIINQVNHKGDIA